MATSTPLTIGIYHGYELTGSGSNEYTRYIARGLARLGHQVHVLCRDRRPASLDYVKAAYLWTLGGAGGLTATSDLLFLRDQDDIPTRETQHGGSVTVHVLPHAQIRPVYVCDKQRTGDVRMFIDLDDAQLNDYHLVCTTAVKAVLQAHPMQVVHANHLVYQPIVCADACKAVGVPFIIFPHGSSIEYTVHRDQRFVKLARDALEKSALIISGSLEVAERIDHLYPDDPDFVATLQRKRAIVGVGTDTSLFKSVGFGKRAAKIANVESFSATFGGKTAEQSQQLCVQLAAGGPEEWKAAMRSYKNSYNHKLPDVEFYNQLASLNWEHRRSIKDSPIVLFVGAMTVGKGIQTLICSFGALLEEYPDAQLIIIGSGSYREVLEGLVYALTTNNVPLLDYIVAHGVTLDKPNIDPEATPEPLEDVLHYLSDAARKKQLLSICAKRNLATHVHFQGRVNHALLSCVFPCADIAVFPSMLTEAYPLVLMESLANGVVPVLPDHSGFSESLRSLRQPLGDAFVDSITMPSDTHQRVAGLHQVLAQLMSQLSDVRGLTPKLRKLAVDRYDWSTRCKEMADAYRTVAKKSPEGTMGRRRGSSEHMIGRADSARKGKGMVGERVAAVVEEEGGGGGGGVSLTTVCLVAVVSATVGVMVSRWVR